MTPPLLPDHAARMARARLSLEGLSVGDAFGERFFANPDLVEALIAARAEPRAPWGYTDDTEMAQAIADVLAQRGGIDPDLLARAFVRRYDRDPGRGYGPAVHGLMRELAAGVPWREAAGALFDGWGSMGNGGAMRVGPVGAYFADDLAALTAHARASAAVTHAHPDGQAGAVAVALAAAYAWRVANTPDDPAVRGVDLLRFVLAHLPDDTDTRAWLEQAVGLPDDASVQLAASVLGTGARVTSADTVPFALWCARRHLRAYEEALWTTVSGLGDRDTTCAIVGSIVVLATGLDAIPPAWRAAREPLAPDAALEYM